MKKTFAFLLTVTLAVSMLTACGHNNEFASATKEELDPEKIGYYSTLELPIDDKFTEITILCDTGIDTANSSIVVEELRRRTGLNINVIAVPKASIAEKSKVLLASKDQMPDIFGGYSIDVNEFGLQGAFEPIDDHIDELPNFKEIFFTKTKENKTEGALRDFRASDGKLYEFVCFDINRAVNSGSMYRKDIFDKHNIPLWDGPDTFYATLKRLKELYPASTPFTVKSKTGLFTRLAESWGIGATNFSAYYDEETKQWKHMVNDPKFKEILDYVKKLYDEKLLDSEFLTITDAAWTAKMTQPDKAFVTNDWIGRMSLMKEATKNTCPEFDLRYAPPIGPTQKVITLPLVDHGPGIKKGKNSLLAMKLCDYLISPSGAQLLTLGIEGVTYTMGEDGFADYIGFDDGEPVTINELENKYGMFISSMYRRFDKRSVYYEFTEREQEAQDMMLNKPDGFEPADPKLTFTAEEKSVIDGNQSKIQTAVEEFASKYILSSETGDAAWNAWIQRMDDLCVNDVVKAYNSAQARYDQLQ